MNPTNECQDRTTIQALADRKRIREQQKNAGVEFSPDEDGGCAIGPRPDLVQDIRKKLPLWKKAGLLLLGLTMIVVLVGLIMPPLQQTRWVGGTDLDITFVVTDADNDQPLQGAQGEDS